ncbi:30S ribosomal protein S20 [Lactococcus piscium]|uniref:Small ribosomal subunit protein bS20 n=1 Tax=Pseudolactococcus paracarnosus TaxID=2749962 RepID=A0A7L4WEY7_9LACT|nr:30S ribosomal protein S20 [Lactococcus paracarnosus]MCJ1994320.1 30S ribosomal protein S20 [Lactococcus paracarnosus]QDJ28043.1 30S ribosomal protein S20 [Lactococcus paracarnosus]SPC35584.1 30S ribosomal protein S20 [Lactococcus piscium]
MANIKSAIKRAELNIVQKERNSGQKAALRTSIKKFEAAVAAGAEDAQALYVVAAAVIDRAHSKGLIHKNKANRDKSRLSKKLAK